MILSLQTKSYNCYGGIPTYNRLISRALNEVNWVDDKRVLIAMDECEDVERAAQFTPNLHLYGFGGNRVKFVLAALRIVLSNPVEILLAGHVNYAPLCLLLKWLRPRLRVGVSIHGCEVWDKMPFLRRFALQRADFILSVSDYTKRHAARSNGLQEDRIIVLANALEWTADEFTPSTKAPKLPQGIKLLSVGRVDATEQRKGFDTVIESLPFVALEVPSVQYLIIGDGTDLDRHRQLAKEMGVSERVHLLGNVDDETLRHCYQACDVFVMPSAQEGFGFVYLEAMQYGKPVVAAKCGGSPEVVEDGVTGALTEYGNVQELGAAITRLCCDRELRVNLGSAGKKRLNQKFTFSHFKQTFVQILQKQLRSPHVPDGVLADNNAVR